jgi:putative transposase
VQLDKPRDRNGTFEPQIVPKGVRRLDGIDKIVLGLYAKGMTVRDIQAHLAEIYHVEVSPDLISKITDAVHAEVAEWQMRPLDSVYPVVFLDALVCKVRDNGSVRTRPRTWPSASTTRVVRRSCGSGSRPTRAPSSGCG